MKESTLWMAVASVAMVAGGCATPGGGPRTATCAATQSECRIAVIVTANCGIDVPIDKLLVESRQGRPVELVWEIQGDATFAPGTGIAFKPAGFVPGKPGYGTISDPTHVFIPSPTPPASNKEFRRRNTAARGEYYYGVNVVQGGRACREYDPGVVNQSPVG